MQTPEIHRAATTIIGQGPAYRIHTHRLVLRCWEPQDAPLLKAAIDANIDHLRPWMPWAQHEPEDLHTKIERLRRWRGEFDLGQDFAYGLFNRTETQVLGSSGLLPVWPQGHAKLGIGYIRTTSTKGLPRRWRLRSPRSPLSSTTSRGWKFTVTPTTSEALPCHASSAFVMRRRCGTAPSPTMANLVIP